MRSKKPDHPCPARSYCSADMCPRCWKSISVRPSPRSVSTTVISSYASSPGWSERVKTSRSGSTTSRYSPFHWISRRPGSANIVSRHEPPGLTSIETVSSGTSDSLPPNQSAKRSGSVHSFHTRSRGASKTRVIVIPSAILQTLVEAVEASLPEPTVLLEPVDRLLQRRPLQARGPKLRRAAAPDQSGVLEDLEVLGDRLDADRERLCELVHRGLTLREALQDRTPRRIGEGCEGAGELVDCHLLVTQSV